MINKIEDNVYSKRATTIVNKKVRQMTNILESVPFKVSKNTQAILDMSNFNKIRSDLAEKLSRDGRRALAIIPFGDYKMIFSMEIFEYEMFGVEEQGVVLRTEQTYQGDKQAYEIYLEYKRVGKNVEMKRYIYQINEIDGVEIPEKVYVKPEQDYTFKDLASLPVKIFENNHMGNCDVSFYEVSESLALLNKFDKELLAEWRRTRTLPYFNTTYTDLEPKKETEMIDKGKSFIQEDGYSAKAAPGFQMLPANAGTQILQQNIMFIEADIYEKLYLKTSADNSGTNKHSLQILLKDEELIEEILNKKLFREKQWKHFFYKLDLLTGDKNKIELKVSKLFAAKLMILEDTLSGNTKPSTTGANKLKESK